MELLPPPPAVEAPGVELPCRRRPPRWRPRVRWLRRRHHRIHDRSPSPNPNTSHQRPLSPPCRTTCRLFGRIRRPRPGARAPSFDPWRRHCWLCARRQRARMEAPVAALLSGHQRSSARGPSSPPSRTRRRWRRLRPLTTAVPRRPRRHSRRRRSRCRRPRRRCSRCRSPRPRSPRPRSPRPRSPRPCSPHQTRSASVRETRHGRPRARARLPPMLPTRIGGARRERRRRAQRRCCSGRGLATASLRHASASGSGRKRV